MLTPWTVIEFWAQPRASPTQGATQRALTIIKAIVGHSAKDITSGYGRSDGQLYDLTTLDSELQRLRYEGLDLTALEGKRPWRAVRSSFD